MPASDRVVYLKIPRRRRGKRHHYGGDVCGLVVLGVDGTFCTIPTVENLQGGSFSFPPEPIALKLLRYFRHPTGSLKAKRIADMSQKLTYNSHTPPLLPRSCRRYKRCPPARHPTTTTSTSMTQATCPCLTLRHWPGTYRTGCLAVSARRRQGDQGIAAAATATLAPWAHPPKRCARVGAALSHWTRRASSPHAGPWRRPGPGRSRGRRGRDSNRGRGGLQGGGGRGRVGGDAVVSGVGSF